MIITATGHRPEALGGYGEAAFQGLVAFAKKHLLTEGVERYNIGMAQGWDQAVGVACHAAGIPFIAFVPYEGYSNNWPVQAQFRYANLLDNAQEVRVLEPEYKDGCLTDRNLAMLDAQTSEVLALYSGSQGGTQHTVRKALERGIPVTNLWPKYKRLFAT